MLKSDRLASQTQDDGFHEIQLNGKQLVFLFMAATDAPRDSAARPWAVQVAALNVRAEADAVAKRLASKGYAAYVVAPADGATVFRVRVGKFSSRDEAEPVKAKLEKEELFKPWITR